LPENTISSDFNSLSMLAGFMMRLCRLAFFF